MKFFICFCLFFLTCSFGSYDQKKYGYQKVGNPYKIGKTTYYPKKYGHLVEEGFISWYGPNFHGKKTANGAIFNQNDYTVAHKTLQLPCVIEITNLENNKKVIAVVNDRGPFSETQSRILDASKQVAKDLGFLEQGVIKGRIRLLKQETKNLLAGKRVKLGPVGFSSYPAKDTKSTKHKEQKKDFSDNDLFKQSSRKNKNTESESIYFVEVAKFLSSEKRVQAVKHLRGEGFKNISIIFDNEEYQELQTLRLGPFSEKSAEKVLTKLQNLGYYNSNIFILN